MGIYPLEMRKSQKSFSYDMKKSEVIQGLNLRRLRRIGIIYEDNHLLVLSKPACVPTVPDFSKDMSLLDWGKMYLKKTRNKQGNVFLGVIHRLDRPVSGIVCFAITSRAASRLSEQVRTHKMSKIYLALTEKKPVYGHGILEHIIRKNSVRNMAEIIPNYSVKDKGKFARTTWTLLDVKKNVSLLKLDPETGRPHQLRIQCAAMGCPLIGDVKYGARYPLPDASIALHAFKLDFLHPVRREWLKLSIPPPNSGPWRPFALLYDNLN
jgi:23S rRNA pseudouridine1911/1915/1917 synthase